MLKYFFNIYQFYINLLVFFNYLKKKYIPYTLFYE